MPKQVTIQIPITENQPVLATSYITRVYIVADDTIYWEIETVYNEQVVRKQYYNCPFTDLSQNYFPEGITFETQFENSLFEQSVIIDNMPTGTAEEKAAKNARYGTSIGEVTPVRVETV